MEELKEGTALVPLLQSRDLVLVQMGAESCAPCKALRAKLDRWSEAHPRVRCLYVPVEAFPREAAREGIFTVPAILFYVRGQLTLREVGCFSLEELLHRVERYASLVSAEADLQTDPAQV